MTILHKSKRLKKELTLFNVYAIATGATLSSGFFLLPGLAAAEAGPAVVLSYMIAAIHLIPAVFSMAELSTAMPRAGGIYYFLDRSLGPLFGTIGGLGTWLALVLKTAFALIGMGAYVGLLLPEIPVVPLAIFFAVVFGSINVFGVRKTGGFQVILVIGLLLILSWFMGLGVFQLKAKHFMGFFQKGFNSIYSTAGLVYISYVGLTNIASVSEEVKDPEKNLPLGMLLALVSAVVIYGLGISVMVGLVPPDAFYSDLTPVATAAKSLVGPWGAVLMSVAAVLAFFSVSNAAILSASRYPLAMSRDHILPRFFRFLGKHRTPKISIYVTVGFIILFLIVFDPTNIAKLASAFQLLLFALSCVAVIIMRESRIESYDPGYRSPLYPWMQIFGIVAPLWLIIEMGWWPVTFMIGLVVLGTVWYFCYARKRVSRDGSIYHIFARLGERRFEGLDR
jgi:amino acid transporter